MTRGAVELHGAERSDWGREINNFDDLERGSVLVRCG
jgi:hypothetical protein